MSNIQLDYDKIKAAIKIPQTVFNKTTFNNHYKPAFDWNIKFHTIGHKRFKNYKGFYNAFKDFSFYHKKKN